MKNLYNLVKLFFEDIKATADKNTYRNIIVAIYNNLISGNYPQWEGCENDINAIISSFNEQEFFNDISDGTLRKFISYKKSAFNPKYSMLICFNFNGENLIKLQASF